MFCLNQRPQPNIFTNGSEVKSFGLIYYGVHIVLPGPAVYVVLPWPAVMFLNFSSNLGFLRLVVQCIVARQHGVNMTLQASQLNSGQIPPG